MTVHFADDTAEQAVQRCVSRRFEGCPMMVMMPMRRHMMYSAPRVFELFGSSEQL